MAIEKFVLTNAGKALLAKAQAGTKIEFTGVEMGSGVLAADAVATAAGLASKEADMQLSSVEVVEKDAYIEVHFSNKNLKEGFRWSEVGLFANDPQSGKILYAYGSTEEPDSIPAGTGGSDYEFIFNMITTIENAADVSVNITGSLVYATLDDLKGYAEEAPDDGKSYVRKNQTWSEATSKKTCRFVVGSSTAGYTAADVDYLCDGTADQVEINAAINALPESGGEIKLLDGTYTLTGGIIINKDKVSLHGNGNNTVISRAFTSDIDTKDSMLYINANYCKIQELYILDDFDDFDASDNSYTIYTLGNNITFCNNTITLVGSTTDSPSCFYLGDGKNNVVKNNYFYCSHGSNFDNFLKVVDNLYSIISGNNIQSNNGWNSFGIVVTGKGLNTITGNYIDGYADLVAGIKITSDNNTVTGNNINVVERGDFDGYGLYISGNWNTVSGNKCDDTTSYDTYNGSSVSNIYVSGTNNAITGNSAGYSSTVKDFWNTIHLTSTSANNLIANNNVFGKPVTDLGTGNTVRGNKSAAIMPPEGRRSSRFVVGSSTAGYTNEDVDFLCTGTDDQIVINAAIDALPDGGGKIKLLDGTYTLTGGIQLNKADVKLSGNGESTKICRQYFETENYKGMVQVDAVNCTVENLQLVDDSSWGEEKSEILMCCISVTKPGGYIHDLSITNGATSHVDNRSLIGINVSSESCRIENNKIKCQMRYNVIGIRASSASYTAVINNDVYVFSISRDAHPIRIQAGQFYRIANNCIHSNSEGGDSKGILLSCTQSNVLGNTLSGGDRQTSYGIYLEGDWNIISDNSILGTNPDESYGWMHGYGIYVTSKNNIINSNSTIYPATPTSVQHTITLTNTSSNNLVTGNNIFGKNVENLGTNNTLANNKYN